MGLAVYNSIILDIRFPACCYKKLLSPAVVPYNNPRAVVGVTPLTVNDLKTVQPVCIINVDPQIHFKQRNMNCYGYFINDKVGYY